MSTITTFISILCMFLTVSSVECQTVTFEGKLSVHAGFLSQSGKSTDAIVASIVSQTHPDLYLFYAKAILDKGSTLSKQLRVRLDLHMTQASGTLTAHGVTTDTDLSSSKDITCSNYPVTDSYPQAQCETTKVKSSSGSKSTAVSALGFTCSSTLQRTSVPATSTSASSSSSRTSGLAALPTSVDVYKVVVVPAIALAAAVVA
ncbi:hypothetical protein MRB53_037454 [Persea americana]|nr:hypothetical protein MRB53_037454 [Persea americana]